MGARCVTNQSPTTAPLALVFDSAQWLDASTWEVLVQLHTRCDRSHKLMLVLAMRDFEESQVCQSQRYDSIRSSNKFLNLNELVLLQMDEMETKELLRLTFTLPAPDSLVAA